MASLDRTLRRDLENAVKKARHVAEAGARQAIEQLAVHHHEPWGALTPEQRKLRNRLRAHGRQLGDRLDERKGTQTIDRLVGECAYEHWHRLLFARFLAENDLLVEPESGMALSLDECRELARERGMDWLMLASDFAQRMLPQIFRMGDPVLEVTLPPEKRQELEAILEALPREMFVADDSLGWVYQFWQAEQKDKVNKSEKKIGAAELPAVTQLFTEDYMVLFLLHNTLGAWWAGRVLAGRPEIAKTVVQRSVDDGCHSEPEQREGEESRRTEDWTRDSSACGLRMTDPQNQCDGTIATSEDELRKACALPGIDWEYLRFVKGDDDTWRPAAGTFNGWPKAAKDITVLDPCMGSGHFLVFALPILMAFRMEEEGLSSEAAVDAVLRDNLFGLELDPRCTQIAAFNLALAAWRMAGYRALPLLNLACSGLGLNTKKEEWLKLAGNVDRLRRGMDQLYELFQKAPDLGSLINPRALGGNLFVAEFHDLQPLLEKALAQETDENTYELAVTARGVAKAAEILCGQFTLVATNVPYLGRGKQDDVLTDYCERIHPAAKADLATCFVERCLDFCVPGGSAALVTPQNWLFLGTYKALRAKLLSEFCWNCVSRLGPRAFETITGEVVNVALLAISRWKPNDSQVFAGLDCLEEQTPSEKADALRAKPFLQVPQSRQLRNPDARVAFEFDNKAVLVSRYAIASQGIPTSDGPLFIRKFWEIPAQDGGWEFHQSTVEQTTAFGGRENIILFENGAGRLRRMSAEQDRDRRRDFQGANAWGRPGVAVSLMQELFCTLFTGEKFDNNVSAVVPNSKDLLPALWAYCTSSDFSECVRQIDQKLNVTNATLVKVPFDLAHWQKVAAEKYPDGLPKPHSDDPTQWLFNGHPHGSDAPLQIAVARLVGYRWPRQTGSSFSDCSPVGPDGLEKHTDDDGIVCLMSLKGEQSAADRLRALLADAFASEWSAAKLNQLLDAVGFGGKSLEDWLRDGFFEQHCELFHQRPFVWHLSDGLKNGFSALVNYHRLAAPSGEGRRTLEKLIYTYLGDWIDRQRADQRAGVEGADARVAAAEHLKRELEKILEGEPPYDIFVRWKPLHEQPIGWEPDLNDGVRLNIRPFMIAKSLNARGKNTCILRVTPKIKWEKDRGKEPSRPKDEYPWFWSWDEQTADFIGGSTFDGNRWNDLDYSRATKLAARERAKCGGKS